MSSSSARGRALLDSLAADLAAETGELRQVLAGLSEPDWRRPTPAAGWSVADQVSHLAYFDDATILSMTDPERFRRAAADLAARGDDFPDQVAATYHDTPPRHLLQWLDQSRAVLIAEFRRADPFVRLPWFGPAMSAASSATARLMETWAHGQDVLDTFGIAQVPTARLRHVADIGIRALPYAFTVHGLDVPDDPVRVELTGPDGDQWTWGPQEAPDRVTGTALDFCLVVTQRRHRSDTALGITGTVARQWMSIAQSFAGPAGPGRSPGAVPASPAPPPAPSRAGEGD